MNSVVASVCERVPRDDGGRREGERCPEDRPRHGSSSVVVVRAVLFDWGNTLVRFEWDDELLVAGHRAGPGGGRTRRRGGRPSPSASAPRSTRASRRTTTTPRCCTPSSAWSRRTPRRSWWPSTTPGGRRPRWRRPAHALLESLRDQGLKLAVVTNHWPEPAWLVREEIERFGVAERVDAIVLAGEVGARKPDPAIFRRALQELGVDAVRRDVRR